VPGYWRDETSGLLAPAVWRYLRGESLTSHDLSLLRAYLMQWMTGPFQGESVDALRRQIAVIQTEDDLAHWVSWALDEGIDPF
jgi:hypothetical protein